MAPSSISNPLFYRRSDRQRGVALIIVLGFVVLLSGLILAFFSRSIGNRQLSDSSSSQVRVELFAQGALAQILGDFKQEILLGSGTTSLSGSAGFLYYPNAPWNALPSRSGTIGGTELPANLLKRSAYGSPFFGGAGFVASGSARASALQTTGTSLNGRTMSLERWNKALLLPKASATSTDATPATGGTISLSGTNIAWSFAAPDWVLVSRDATNPVITDGTSSLPSDLKWSTTNSKTVIGRYAYCIYDEGGLLDMNVAGYPFGSDGLPQISPADLGRKGALALADLTQLPVSPTENLTAQQAAAIVGWRNQFTLQAGTASSSLTGTSNAYINMLISNTNGFLQVNGASGNTDNAFVSRQSLIRFLLSGTVPGLGQSQAQNLLQYMGTFSRGLEQPSYRPDPNRPRIAALSGSTSNNGGNDAYGLDSQINPAFPEILASAAFPRNDGSTAASGEPLVKTRFALDRLAWLTCKGPSADLPASDPVIKAYLAAGIKLETLQRGNLANIAKYFGLTWVPTDTSPAAIARGGGHYWRYSSGAGLPTGRLIGRLSEIAALGREPNFFELLKAALNIGSLGKSLINTSVANEPGLKWQYINDTTTDFQVLQIGANIIGQYSPDSYPQRIACTLNDGSYTEFAGIENLPYLYRSHNRYVCYGVPDGMLSHQAEVGDPNTGTIKYWAATAQDWAIQTDVDAWKTNSAFLLYVPTLWNPHDPNSSMGATVDGVQLRPTEFQWVANYLDVSPKNPSVILNQAPGSYANRPATGIYGKAGPYGVLKSGSFGLKSPLYSDTALGPSWPWNADSTALQFEVTSNALFREPTHLAKPGLPTGSNLRLGPNHSLISAPFSFSAGIPDNSTFGIQPPPGYPRNYIGALLGVFPQQVVSGTSLSSGTVSPLQGWASPYGYTEKYSTQRLQCKDAFGNWITYSQRYGMDPYDAGNGYHPNYFLGDLGNYSSGTLCGFPGGVAALDKLLATLPWLAPYSTSQRRAIYWDARGGGYAAAAYDPRVIRFAFTGGWQWIEHSGMDVLLPLSADGTMIGSDRCTLGAGQCYESIIPPSTIGYYASKSSAFGIRIGLLSQNNPAFPNDGITLVGLGPYADAGSATYYTDPDGVVRRAMGAYTSDTTSSVGLPMITGDATNPATPDLTLKQWKSRPVVLNRPFKSVAELGYVCRDMPWRNLDFFTPESGDTALLDVFCVHEPPPAPLVAGKTHLNSRNAQVLQAIISQVFQDDVGSAATLPAADAAAMAQSLVARVLSTGTNGGPARNLPEMVGRLQYSGTTPASALSAPVTSGAYTGWSAYANPSASSTDPASVTQRFREAGIRSVADTGEIRVWNLLIDLVAQTGRYPATATKPAQFLVEGEKRYWLHVAIDRLTGKVLDRQLEAVSE